MTQIKVKPKNGWKHATEDEMQKLCANMLGERHCMNPQAIYKAFTAQSIHLPNVMHRFMGDRTEDGNQYLLGFVLNGVTYDFLNYINE